MPKRSRKKPAKDFNQVARSVVEGDIVRITAGEYLGAVAKVRSTASDRAVVVMRCIDGTNLPIEIATHHVERISDPPCTQS